MNTSAENLNMDWKHQVKGVILDYGATIDSNGKHWAEVLWEAYVAQGVPITKEAFREAYVYGERYLATHPVIQPVDTFREVLVAKVELQTEWLTDNHFLPNNAKIFRLPLVISNQCYNFVCSVLNEAKPVLDYLASNYPLVLVSNFYGNIETVLRDFGLQSYFKTIVESSVVKIRKPDPAIFDLGVKALNLKPEEVVVIGDSYKKDIVPARSLGCHTIWLQGPAWEADEEGSTADVVIRDFKELRTLL